jgi:acetolactate synthase-1/2/3 large subunit
MQVKRALQMLLEAERPAILAGGGVISANASQELARLAEALLCPVATTLLGKGCISEYHPLALGMAGMHGRRCANHALSNCDVLLAVGTRFSDRITGDLRYFASGARIVHIDVDPSEISKNVPAYLPIVGDAKKVLAAMLAELHAQAAKGKENEWRKRMREMREACECDIGYDETPVKPQRAMKELTEALPEHAIAVTEVGRHQMWAAHFYRAREPRGFISSGGLGTMGFGLPAAIGAKAAKPEQCVVDIAGDGSLLMVNQELATSVEHALPVVVYLLHDNWLGMVRQWQKLFYAKRYSATSLGATPDFVKLAKAYGCEAERVAKPGELKQALKNALKSDVTYLIDIAVDPEEDVLPMVPPGGRLDQMVGLEKCRPKK